jgi:potassium/hydrogen antiporter
VVESIEPFGWTLLVAAVVVSAALLSNRISGTLRVPAPAIFLVVAAAASDLFPSLAGMSVGLVEQIVTVALVVILFDGGMHIGARKIRAALGTILSVGVVGTFLTAGAVALAAHLLFGIPWLLSLLLGTALAPTDPAVVFSVLGNQEIRGRAGVVIEGESGANDPVGIALLVSLLAVDAGSGVGSAALGVAVEFVVQMLVGGAVGVAGGWLLKQGMRRFTLPSEALYPLRTLALSMALYGIATVAHGSGFLAVFVAGILVGDENAPFKREIERFHSSLASLAEIVAFVVLGLTVSLTQLVTTQAWLIALVLAVLLTVVIRPLLVGPLLVLTRMTWGERTFVLWSGLKGAVPILLGTYVLAAGSALDLEVYEVIFGVVLFSVVVQGGLVPVVAARCGVKMQRVESRPFVLGVRVQDQPEGARSFRVEANARADGRSVSDLHLADDVWISLVVRDGNPVQVRPDTLLTVGDEVLVLVDPQSRTDPATIFCDVS